MFKVIEIINAITIRVAPSYIYTDSITQKEIEDNRIQIMGLKVLPENEYAKKRLASLLKDKEVDLINPTLVNAMDGRYVCCNVLIDNTDITYFFPEFRDLVPA